MSKAHTQIPWKLQRNWILSQNNGRGSHTFIATVDGETQEEAEANAALIVRAVNSHAAMKEAITRANALLNAHYGISDDQEGGCVEHDMLRAALKLAGEGE